MGVTLSQKRILLIDDSPEFRDMVRKILETAGASVYAVGSIREGIEIVKTSVPHLVLLDLAVGEESGLDFLKYYTENLPAGAFPVVIVSAQSRIEAIKLAMALGANSYIVKPIKAHNFLTKLRNIMDTFGVGRIVHEFAEPLNGQISIPATIGRMSEIGVIVDAPVRLERGSSVSINSNLLSQMGFPTQVVKVERSGSADATGTYHGFLRFVGMDPTAINRVLKVIKLWPFPFKQSDEERP